MAVYLLRNYGTYLATQTVTLDATTEDALISQGIATDATAGADATSILGAPGMYGSQGGNTAFIPQAGLTSSVTYYQGPLRLPVIALGSSALTGYETAGVAQTAGTWNFVELYVPYLQTWTGAGVLNGTTVGTNKWIVAVWGSNGTLLANSAVAGTTSSGASTMQNIAFTSPITLLPGRYFLGVQADGATDTIRHLLSANGAVACTGTQAGTFGTTAKITTVPTTFTTAVGPIMQLYV